jgi:hypothetical protein
VSLKCANDDVALCLSARFGPQAIVLNTMQGGAWGPEVHLPIGPLKMHAECNLGIRIKKDKFLVGLNGQLHGEFEHRMPRELITQYDVSGLEISSIRFPRWLDFALSAEARKRKKAERPSKGDSVSFGVGLLVTLTLSLSAATADCLCQRANTCVH